MSARLIAARLGFLVAITAPAADAVAQTATNIGRRNTGVTPGMKPSTGAKIEPRTVMKLGAVRNWTSSDGKVVAAELMSWPITDPEATSKDIRDLKIEVVRDGQIRLRRGTATFNLALKRLSAADQAYVKQVVENVAKTKDSPATGVPK